jgi:hypothetical protein
MVCDLFAKGVSAEQTAFGPVVPMVGSLASLFGLKNKTACILYFYE